MLEPLNYFWTSCGAIFSKFQKSSYSLNPIKSKAPLKYFIHSGVWFHPGTSGKLHICFAISGNKNWCYNSNDNDLNEWLNIRIKQGGQLDLTGSGHDKMIYSIYLNNVQVYTTENRQPEDFTAVQVYVGDKWYGALKGHIKNLVIKSIGGSVTTIGTSGKI